MGIKDKQTYGEYYWAMNVEAQGVFDEEIESAFAPYFRGLFADFPEISTLPTGTEKFIRTLAEPPSAGFGGFALGVGVEMVDETLHSLLTPAMKMMTRAVNKRGLETWLTSEQANKLFREDKISEELWSSITMSEGYEPVLGRLLYQSQAPYPSLPDLIRYSRYHGEPDAPWSEIQKWFEVDARDWPVWKWLNQQQLTTLQAQTLFRRDLITGYDLDTTLARIGWDVYDRPLIEELGWSIPNA
ncbi:unnamed protein product, partial [marine sediment metagenome]